MIRSSAWLLCALFALLAGPQFASAITSDLPLDQAARDGNLAEVARLLQSGADPNQTNKWGGNALTGACSMGAGSNVHTDIVKLLLAHGADVNRKVAFGTTAMNEAAFWGHVETARVLLGAGADVNAAKDNGYTPLLSAAATGRVAIVRMLLEAGARTDARTNHGSSARDLAMANGHTEVLRLLPAASSSADP